jgi:hypothetical protein
LSLRRFSVLLALAECAARRSYTPARRIADAPEQPSLKPQFLVVSLALASAAMAEGPTCNAAAKEKKLSGAAKNSFEKKCIRDAVG